MPYVASAHDVELRRAEIMVRKDHRQRWVYRGPNGWTVTDSPIPFKDKTSVYWMPTVGCVGVSYSPRLLAHDATAAARSL